MKKNEGKKQKGGEKDGDRANKKSDKFVRDGGQLKSERHFLLTW